VNVVSHAADGEKTSQNVFPRPAWGAQFLRVLTGDVIPGLEFGHFVLDSSAALRHKSRA
jgi:hypothetical protein